MHVRSSAVDWKLDYDQPPLGLEISLEALFLIVPDLSRIAPNTTDSPFLASISEMSYTDEGGFSATTAQTSSRDSKIHILILYIKFILKVSKQRSNAIAILSKDQSRSSCTHT